MLTLHRDSRTIVTDQNFSVKLKWVNPACYMDTIPGDVGIGIELAVNEYTRTEFGNPERFEKLTSGQDRKFSGVSIRFGGFLLMRGTLIITSATQETYSAWLQSEIGTIGSALRDKYLPDLALPTNQVFVNKMQSEYSPETDDYAAELIGNITFWEGKGRQEEVNYPYYDENNVLQPNPEMEYVLSTQFRKTKDCMVNRQANDGKIDTSGLSVVVSPQLYLHVAVREILKSCGFEIDSNYNKLKESFSNILVYNNYNIMYQTFTTVEYSKPSWNPYVKEMENLSRDKITDTQWYIGTFDYASLLPKISLKDFLVAIQNWLNVIFLFRNDGMVRIIDREQIVDKQPRSIDKHFLGFWSLGERKDVILKFTQDTENNDSIYSDNWHDLDDRRTDFGSPVANKAALNALSPVLGELRLVIDENQIYEYTWGVAVEYETGVQSDVLEWKKASIGPQAYFFGSGNKEIEEIKTSVCPVFVQGYPHVMQKGNVKSMKSLWSDFKLRCLIQLGNYDELIFSGSNGLFAKRWAKWAALLANRLPVEGDFSLPMNELYYVINNISDPYSTREGKFIIEEIECDFAGDLMGNVHIKGYKL